MSQLEPIHDKQIDVPGVRGGIGKLEELMNNCPADVKIDIDVMHHYTDGVYARTVLMKAGDLIVGKIHKKEHLVIISAGRASVISEEFGSQQLVAPMIFKSPPGVKRALLIHEDMIWTTIHKNASNTQDLSVLEGELIATDYTEVAEEKQ